MPGGRAGRGRPAGAGASGAARVFAVCRRPGTRQRPVFAVCLGPSTRQIGLFVMCLVFAMCIAIGHTAKYVFTVCLVCVICFSGSRVHTGKSLHTAT